MLSVEGVERSFGPRARALAGVSFNMTRGERVALLGLNGAGKTTLFRVIAGLLQPDAGRVRVGARDVHHESREAQAGIGFLPETAPCYPELSAEEQLWLLARIRDLAEPRRRVQELIERCGLAELKDRAAGRLSRGYRQRLALAAALLHNPPLLLLDGPTAGLDPRQVGELRNLLADFAKDRAVIISTHVLSEAEAMCGRCLILHRGRLVADLALAGDGGDWEVEWQGGAWPRELSRHTDEPLPEGWCRSKIRLRATADAAAELAELVRAGVRVRRFAAARARLEEAFLRATTKAEEGEA